MTTLFAPVAVTHTPYCSARRGDGYRCSHPAVWNSGNISGWRCTRHKTPEATRLTADQYVAYDYSQRLAEAKKSQRRIEREIASNEASIAAADDPRVGQPIETLNDDGSVTIVVTYQRTDNDGKWTSDRLQCRIYKQYHGEPEPQFTLPGYAVGSGGALAWTRLCDRVAEVTTRMLNEYIEKTDASLADLYVGLQKASTAVQDIEKETK